VALQVKSYVVLSEASNWRETHHFVSVAKIVSLKWEKVTWKVYLEARKCTSPIPVPVSSLSCVKEP